MIKLDEVMKMLNENSDIEVQNEGVELAKKVKSINAFIQPFCGIDSKKVWENCAKVLSSKPDKELQPYLIQLLKWLEDLNYPGAFKILNRLAEYKDKESIVSSFNKYVHQAKVMHNQLWIYGLCELHKLNKLLSDISV